VSSKCNQEPLNQIPSILPNSIAFQTLELPQFLIQILFGIPKRSNKENCSLFQKIQMHILFEIFRAWERPLLIKSI
jgi:hypothetical protein